MNIEKFKEQGHLLIGACGSISILNLFQWIVLLQETFCKNIKVILTDQAQKFVNPDIITQFTGNKTYTDFFSTDEKAAHVELSKWADLMLILPSTSNLIGKVANGISDDLLTSTIINANCPVVLIPSMNITMWNKKAVQRNIKTIIDDGYHIIYDILDSSYKISSGQNEIGIGIDPKKLIIRLSRIVKTIDC